MEALEHFGEQQRSWQMLDEHRDEVVARVRGLLASRPGAQPVGLVVDGTMELAEAIRAGGRDEAELAFDDGDVAIVVTRRSAVHILRYWAPAILEHLAPYDRPLTHVSIVALTPHGARLATVAM